MVEGRPRGGGGVFCMDFLSNTAVAYISNSGIIKPTDWFCGIPLSLSPSVGERTRQKNQQIVPINLEIGGISYM